jgi:thiol-disulfide isomerase/thioredoxin
MMKKIVLFLLMLFSLCTIKAQNDSIRLKKFVVGEKFQNFAYKDVSGKTYSLKDFKGKYVYIDFWATWCEWCLKEIPYLEKLQNDMKGKNIVFLSLSVDEDTLGWKRVVKEEHMGGVQLLAGINFFMFKYYVPGYPHFLLLNKKGKIINNNMTRPSDAATKQTLLGLKGI